MEMAKQVARSIAGRKGSQTRTWAKRSQPLGSNHGLNYIWYIIVYIYIILLYYVLYIDHSLSNERTKEGTDQHTKLTSEQTKKLTN